MKPSRILTKSIAFSLGLSALVLSPSARAANFTWDGEASGNWATAVNWAGDLAPVAGDSLIFTGALNTAAANNFAANTLFNGLTFGVSAAGFTLSGSALNLGGSIVDDSLNAQTISLNAALQATQTVNVSSIDGALTLSGVISGSTFGLTKTGNGLLTLSGANTYTGPVSITGGTLAIASDSTAVSNPLGSGAAGAASLTLDGGAVRSTATTQLSTNRGVLLGDAGAGTGGTIDVATGILTYNGAMTNNGGTNSLAKTGVGTLLLGGVNTYTGNTLINLGALKLDFTQLVGTTSNIINSGSTLVMGGAATALGNANTTSVTTSTAGATLNMTSKSAANSTQTFNGLTLNGGYNTIQTTQTASGNNLLTLGAITHSYPTAALTTYNASYGGVANFSFAGTLSNGVNAINTTTLNSNGTTGAANGILGGWASYGTANPIASYASVDASGNIVAYTGYTAQAAGAITSDTTKNYQQQTAGAIALTTADAATTDINTLSTSTTATGANTITVGTAGTGSTGILRVGATGGFMTGSTAGTFVIGNVAGNGKLTAGGAADTAGEITFLNGNTTANAVGFVLNSNITDNGTGVVSVTYGGTMGSGGRVANIMGTNTYTGGTTLTTGRIFSNTGSGFGTGSVTVYSGAQAYINAGTYANNWFIAGGGSSIASGQPGFYDTPGAIRFESGSTTLNGTVTLLNDAAINSRNNSGSNIAGKITGNYNLILTSSGTTGGNIKISNTSNDWGGNLIIETKTLLLGASGVVPNGAGKGNVVLSAAATSILDLNNFDETINGLSSTASSIVRNSTAGTKTLTLGDGDATSTFGGVIGTSTGQVAITKIGSGTQLLSGTNTTTGAITVQGGTLQLTGVNSTTGATSVTGGTLFLSGSGAVNSSASLTVNGSGARFLHTGTTAVSPAVTLTQGTVQGTGTVSTVNVADLAANTITAGLGNTGTLTIPTLTFNGAATANVANTALLATTTLTANGTAGSVTVNSSGAWTTGNTYNLVTYGGGSIAGTGGFGAFIKGAISGLGARQTTGALADSGTAITLTIGGDTPVWTGAASGVWSQTAVGSPFNWKLQTALTDTEFLNNDAVIFADTIPGGGAPGTTTVTINDATVTPASVVFNNSSVDYTLTGSNGITTGSLIKNGTGKLTIQTPNSYAGATTINAGIVSYENATAFGSSAITVASGATVQAVGGLAGGASALSLSGTGAAGQNGALVNVSGTNSHGGTITLAGSTTISSDSGTLNLTGPGTITGTGFGLTLAGAGDGSLAGAIGTSTGGTLIKNGAGTWTVAAQTTQNNFTGGTTVNEGMLKVTNASGGTAAITTTVLGTGTATVASGATLWLDYELGAAGNDATYANTFSGAGILKVTAPSTGGANFSTAILSGNLSGFTGTMDLYPNSGNFGKTSFTNTTNGNQPSASATIKVENGTTLYIPSGLTYGSSFELYGIGQSENLGTIRIEGNSTISGAVTLKANAALGGNSGGTISGNIGESGGSFAFEKRGGGALILSGTNTYSGGTTLSVGTLSVGTNSALGTGTVTMNGATLSASVAGVNLANTFTANAGITGTFNVANSFTMSGNYTAANANSQIVTGAGALTWAGTNSLTLNSANNAGLSVRGGSTLQITGSTTVDGGAANQTGFVSIGDAGNGTVTVPAGGSLSILGSTVAVPNSILGQGGNTGVLNVNGGTVTYGANTGVILANANAVASGTINVTSGLLTITKGTVSNNFGADANPDTTVVMMGRDNATATGTINLSGGTLETDRQFVRDGSSGAGAGIANFNFNGGTLKALGDQADWLRSSATTNFLALSAVTVQSGGAVVDTNGFNVGINNNLADGGGGGGLTKNGSGTLTLGGTDAYTGATMLNAGTLLVSGSIAGSTTTVNGGTLGGAGGTTGAVVVNGSGSFAPGASIGTLNTGTLALNSTAQFKLEIDTNAVSTDLANVTGDLNLDLANTAVLTLSDLGANVALALNTTFTFMDYSGTWNGGTFAGLADDSTFIFGANEFQISYNGVSGSDTAVTLAVIPEPGSAVSLLGGLGVLLGLRRRRK